MSDVAEILFERRGAIGLVTLNRPKALNALTQGMCVAMKAQLDEWAKDDAVKSVRIIVEAIVAAVQSGLGQRDSRRSAKAQADFKAVTAAAAAAAGLDEDADLSKVELPAGAVVEGDTEAAAVAKKKPTRAKKAPVKAE